MSIFKKQPGRWVRVVMVIVISFALVSLTISWATRVAEGDPGASPWGTAALWSAVALANFFTISRLEDSTAYYRDELFKAREAQRDARWRELDLMEQMARHGIVPR